jgi:basic membrane lipoprotein Med (substrate-binding protein (PBP1-ABC) superfamily)
MALQIGAAADSIRMRVFGAEADEMRFRDRGRRWLTLAVLAVGCADAARAAEPPEVPAVFAAYVTPVAEPWNAVIHAALAEAERAGRIRYTWRDALDTAEKQLEALEQAAAEKPDVIVADAADAGDEVAALARNHPRIAFLLGGPEKPQPPNVSTFDSDLAEPAYLCGLVAGKMTKSNIVGVVAGKHDADVHRTVNAFVAGARAANPDVKAKVTFIDAWFDPPQARAAALAQVAAGADMLFAERAGAIAAAKETGVLAFGDMVDQHEEAPDHVVTGTVWNMRPVIDHAIARATAGEVTAEDLGRFCTLAKEGVALAPWHGWEKKLPADVLRLVEETRAALAAGTLALDVSTDAPAAE